MQTDQVQEDIHAFLFFTLGTFAYQPFFSPHKNPAGNEWFGEDKISSVSP
jgi:hypothetical protein